MQLEESIKDLLRSTSSINHLLAIELMQSQYGWSLEESLKALFPVVWIAYGRSSLEQWLYSIGQFDLHFTLEINDENLYAVFNSDLYLILSLKHKNRLLFKDSYFVDTIQRGEAGRNIKELEEEVYILFDKALASICVHLKAVLNR